MCRCGDDGDTLELAAPFRRVTMHSLVQEATGTDFWALRSDPAAARQAAEQAVPQAAARLPEGG